MIIFGYAMPFLYLINTLKNVLDLSRYILKIKKVYII